MAEQSTVLVALGMLRSHYPGEHPAIEEATVLSWHGAGLVALPDAAVLDAAAEWDTSTYRRFPTSGDFLREAQAAARRSVLAAEEPDEWALPVSSEVVGGFRLPVMTDTDRAYVDSLRIAWTAKRDGGDFYDALNAALAERGVGPVLPEEPADVLGTPRPLDFMGRGEDQTVRCLACTDSGWLSVTANGATMVAPCRECRPIAHRRWAQGHRLVNHDCDECRMFRRGKPPAWAQELIGQGYDHRPRV